jgi:hypothetical protein
MRLEGELELEMNAPIRARFQVASQLILALVVLLALPIGYGQDQLSQGDISTIEWR